MKYAGQLKVVKCEQSSTSVSTGTPKCTLDIAGARGVAYLLDSPFGILLGNARSEFLLLNVDSGSNACVRGSSSANKSASSSAACAASMSSGAVSRDSFAAVRSTRPVTASKICSCKFSGHILIAVSSSTLSKASVRGPRINFLTISRSRIPPLLCTDAMNTAAGYNETLLGTRSKVVSRSSVVSARVWQQKSRDLHA